ncbi:MAG: hypothetical protein E7452_08405 [Ruminococcaceae bacterium]|nr:hypothetical protein [Oscillospiraceae bacterium]
MADSGCFFTEEGGAQIAFCTPPSQEVYHKRIEVVKLFVGMPAAAAALGRAFAVCGAADAFFALLFCADYIPRSQSHDDCEYGNQDDVFQHTDVLLFGDFTLLSSGRIPP